MRFLIPLLLAGLIGVPMASAGGCGGEPCGYIVPIMDLEFPEKQLCGGGRIMYEGDIPDDCQALLENGGSWTMDGHVRWYWDAQEEPTYPFDPSNPQIVISFSGTQSNPKWLDVKVEPAEIVVGIAELYNPDNYDVDAEGNPIAWFNFRQPITVTITRNDDPDAKWLDKIGDRKGVVPIFVKARSTASPDWYRESFGVEEFRFNACYGETPEACPFETATDSSGKVIEAPTNDRESPGFAPLTLTLALAAMALALRRRD